jgi:hypothetical protein
VSRVLHMSADRFPGRAVSKLRVDRLAFALGGLRPLRFRPWAGRCESKTEAAKAAILP